MREVSAVEGARGGVGPRDGVGPRAAAGGRRLPFQQAIDPIVAAAFDVEVDDLKAPTRRSHASPSPARWRCISPMSPAA